MKRGALKRKTPLKRKSYWPKRGNKFRAIQCADKDHQYDSRNEMRRWYFLQTLERGGVITDLEFKPKVTLIAEEPHVSWTLDYRYKEQGRWVYEDSKPRPYTAEERLLMKLWVHFGPGLLKITASSKDNFKTRKTVMARANRRLDQHREEGQKNATN